MYGARLGAGYHWSIMQIEYATDIVFRHRRALAPLYETISRTPSYMPSSLRVHGLIKRIGRRYKYYVTDLGRRAIITGLRLRELFVLPQLASDSAG